MIFGFDLDGCVINFASVLLKTVNELYDAKYTLSNITHYNLHYCLNITEEEEDNAVNIALKKWTEWKPYPGVLEFIEKYYKKTNNTVYFITSRQEEYRNQTLDWIDSYLDCHVICQLIMNKDKVKEAHKRYITHFIEDKPTTAKYLADSNIIVFLPNRPWNQNMEQHKNTIRFDSYDEIKGI